MRSLPPVLVTGASGFIGRHLVDRLLAAGMAVRSLVREKRGAARPGEEVVAVGDFSAVADFAPALAGCTAVVHLAGQAHKFGATKAKQEAGFHAVNSDATQRLAEAANMAGIRKFVFISSIGVHGSASSYPITESSPLSATEPYSASKLSAEMGLRDLAWDRGLDITIVRPPLVYGPGCPGNLRRLAGLIKKRLPLPFGLANNRRSMISVENLCDAVMCCLESPESANETFVVADTDAMETSNVIRHLAAGMGLPALLFPFPMQALVVGGKMAGYGDEILKLTSSLEVDASKIRQKLGWRPVIATGEGLRAVGRSFAKA